MSGENKINKDNGFMLLEVILSVLVVSIGVVFVISSFITSLKAFKLSKVYVDAVYLIEQKLWEYEETGRIEDGRSSGKFDDYKGAEWEIKAKEMDDLPMEETSAEIAIKNDDKKRTFTVVTYFYKES